MDSDSINTPVSNERQLAQLRTAISRLLDQTSHDFRTPLTVIKEFATLMRDGLVGAVNQRQCDYLEVINDRADDLTAMVYTVLDAGKLHAGLLRLWRQPTDVAQVVGSLSPLLSRKAASKGIAFATALEPNLPTVHADQDQLPRILNNLVAEGLDAFSQPKSMRLWARSRPEHHDVCLGLTVCGGHVDPKRLDTLRKAMDPSESCDIRTTDDTSLGLGLARRLVELHLGQTAFESTDDGEATFRFTLPLHDPMRLFDSYVHHLQATSRDQHEVGLIAASINPRVKSTVAKVVDEFLQQWTGENDLALRVEKHRWLLLVEGDETHTQDWLHRIEADWTETLESRPGGLLPRLQWTAMDQWTWTEDAQDLTDRVHTEMAPTVDPGRCPVVLLVDDDTAFLQKSRPELERAGYQVLTATDGQAALDTVGSSSPDVIIVDSRLPSMDGLAVLAALRDQPSTADIPVIFASVGSADQSQALDLGARLVLTKPVAPSSLVDVLARVVDPPITAPAPGIPNKTLLPSGI